MDLIFQVLIALIAVMFAVICAVFCSKIANSKGWDSNDWAVCGFLFGPIALLAACGLPDKKLRVYVRALAEKLEALEDVNSQELRVNLDPELIRTLDPELISLLDPKLIPLLNPALLKLVNMKNSKILPNEIYLKDEMHNTLIRAFRNIFTSDESEWKIKYQSTF